MSEPKADLTGWDLRYDDLADAAKPGDELTMYNVTMYNDKKASRGHQWTATVESVDPREMTLDDEETKTATVEAEHEVELHEIEK